MQYFRIYTKIYWGADGVLLSGKLASMVTPQRYVVTWSAVYLCDWATFQLLNFSLWVWDFVFVHVPILYQTDKYTLQYNSYHIHEISKKQQQTKQNKRQWLACTLLQLFKKYYNLTIFQTFEWNSWMTNIWAIYIKRCEFLVSYNLILDQWYKFMAIQTEVVMICFCFLNFWCVMIPHFDQSHWLWADETHLVWIWCRKNKHTVHFLESLNIPLFSLLKPVRIIKAKNKWKQM